MLAGTPTAPLTMPLGQRSRPANSTTTTWATRSPLFDGRFSAKARTPHPPLPPCRTPCRSVLGVHVLIRPMSQTCRARTTGEASTRLAGQLGQACICSLWRIRIPGQPTFITVGIIPPPPVSHNDYLIRFITSCQPWTRAAIHPNLLNLFRCLSGPRPGAPRLTPTVPV